MPIAVNERTVRTDIGDARRALRGKELRDRGHRVRALNPPPGDVRGPGVDVPGRSPSDRVQDGVHESAGALRLMHFGGNDLVLQQGKTVEAGDIDRAVTAVRVDGEVVDPGGEQRVDGVVDDGLDLDGDGGQQVV